MRSVLRIPKQMPGCVLHISGDDFRVDDFLSGSELQPYRVHHRGEVGRRSRVHTDSGFSLGVSDADGDLCKEIEDAIKFLNTNEPELRRLRDFPGVTDLRLDFGLYFRNVAAQFDYLPPDLLASAGNLGIGIELSLYAASEPETPGAEQDAADRRRGNAGSEV